MTATASPPPERHAHADALREKVDRYLTGEIEIGSFPGAVYAIGSSSGILTTNALGHSVLKPAKIRNSIDTIYDVASLTKPLITGTLVLQTAAEGKIELTDPVSRFVPELDTPEKKSLTFLQLLTHVGGFQAWYPLYALGQSDEAYLDALVRRPLRYKPGTREIYSCLNFVLLHLAIERIHGRSSEELAEEKIFRPLGLERSLFNPAPERKFEIAATEWGNANERRMVSERGLNFPHFRNYVIWGEVDDGNAYYLGGNAGNAGLFSTAADVFTIGQAWLRRDERLLPRSLYDIAVRNHTLGLEENRGLGWQLPALKPNHATTMLSDSAFGHTGFSGTSIWVDPERDLIMVLLTNRLHPNAQPLNMQTVRRNFHQIVTNEWDAR